MTPERTREILSLRAGGRVLRWHAMPHVGQQTVADHCGHAVGLLFLLHPSPGEALVKSLLWHDQAERVVGDMPSPGKRAFPTLGAEYERAEAEFLGRYADVAAANSSLTEEDLAWLSAIDRLERYLFLRDQEMLGNAHAVAVADRQRAALTDPSVPEPIREFVRTESQLRVSERSFA